MNNLFNELTRSYKNCVTRLNIDVVSPYNEFEFLKPLANYWQTNVTSKILELDPKTFNKDTFNNPSVLRSMLIMDLFDCSFSNVISKQSVFEWYVELIKQFYLDDIFSIEKNTHTLVDINKIKNALYFETRDESLLELMNKCFEYSYAKNGDIFADNTYEVLGPFYINNKTAYINQFHINNKTYSFVFWCFGQIAGQIDMFGHCDLTLIKPHIVLFENDDLHVTNSVNIDFDCDTCKDEYGMLNSRLQRYTQFCELDLQKIHSDCEKILNNTNIVKNRSLSHLDFLNQIKF